MVRDVEATVRSTINQGTSQDDASRFIEGTIRVWATDDDVIQPVTVEVARRYGFAMTRFTRRAGDIVQRTLKSQLGIRYR